MSITLARERADRIVKGDAEWLMPEQYRIMRQHGTGRAGTSSLNEEKRAGVFTCAFCGEPLFNSDAKFNGAALTFNPGDP